MPSSRTLHRLRVGIVALALIALSGCGVTIPSDPNGSLSQAAGEKLRIGVTVEAGLAEPGSPPAGPLPQLARAYADSINATPEWVVAGEESLVRQLEDGRLDIAFGNFSEESRWVDRAALSRPFSVSESASNELVAFLPLGENALLASFETFIDMRGSTQ